MAFSAEGDGTEPHDVEADPLTVSRVGVFSWFFQSSTSLNLLYTSLINQPFELFLPSNPFITRSGVNLFF